MAVLGDLRQVDISGNLHGETHLNQCVLPHSLSDQMSGIPPPGNCIIAKQCLQPYTHTMSLMYRLMDLSMGYVLASTATVVPPRRYLYHNKMAVMGPLGVGVAHL